MIVVREVLLGLEEVGQAQQGRAPVHLGSPVPSLSVGHHKWKITGILKNIVFVVISIAAAAVKHLTPPIFW